MARFCPKCGTSVQDDQTFCPNCGTRVADPEGAPASDFYPPFTAQEAGSVGGQPYAQSVYPNAGQGFGPRCTTRKEFLMLPENKKLRSQIRGAAIICYICGGLTLLLMIISLNLMMLLDVAILVGLGLGVHLAYSRVCAILLAVYAVFSVIVGLVVNGTISGWLIVVAAVFAVLCTFNLEKGWKIYQQH